MVLIRHSGRHRREFEVSRSNSLQRLHFKKLVLSFPVSPARFFSLPFLKVLPSACTPASRYRTGTVLTVVYGSCYVEHHSFPRGIHVGRNNSTWEERGTTSIPRGFHVGRRGRKSFPRGFHVTPRGNPRGNQYFPSGCAVCGFPH